MLEAAEHAGEVKGQLDAVKARTEEEKQSTSQLKTLLHLTTGVLSKLQSHKA